MKLKLERNRRSSYHNHPQPQPNQLRPQSVPPHPRMPSHDPLHLFFNDSLGLFASPFQFFACRCMVSFHGSSDLRSSPTSAISAVSCEDRNSLSFVHTQSPQSPIPTRYARQLQLVSCFSPVHCVSFVMNLSYLCLLM